MPQFLPGPGTGIGLQERVSVPAPTLIQAGPRVNQVTANSRSRRFYTASRNRRQTVILRAPSVPTPTIQSGRPTVVVSRSAVRAATRTRMFAQRTARAVRPPTAAPAVYVRPKIVVKKVRRSPRHHYVRHVPVYLTGVGTSTPAVLLPKPVVSRTAVRAATRTRYFAQRSNLRIVRPPAPPPAVYIRPKIVTSRAAVRAATRTKYFAQRQSSRVLRAPVTVTGPYVRPTIIVRRQRRNARQYVRHLPVILAGASFATPTPLRPLRQPLLGRNNRKATYTRTFYRRHPATVSANILPPPAVVVTPPASGVDQDFATIVTGW